MMITRFSACLKSLGIFLLTLLMESCTVGPDYQHPPPASPPAPHYKELPGWIHATPADTAPKGDWWIDFHDPLLNELEPLVEVSNQTIKADYQNYQAALALIQEANAQLFPVVSATGTVTRSKNNAGTTNVSNTGFSSNVGSSFTTTQGTVESTLSWSPDIWGVIRRTIEEDTANAQASKATLANATLSTQVTLATTLINLRITDTNIDLLNNTIAEYQKNLRIIANAVKAGYNLYPPSDEVTARVELETAEANLIALGVARAQYEHAIAVLVGKNPEEIDIPHSKKLPTLPHNIPVGVPSTLLQRRPDIAAAERTMAAENEAIGIAIAAYYPNVTLSSLFGFNQVRLRNLFSAANTIWSTGTTGTETVLDFGSRAAQVAVAQATYQSAVATYRATVLSAFQHVEDDLASLRILAQQAKTLNKAVHNAQYGATLARNEYLAGTVDYTTVATAQITALTNEQTLLNVQQSQLVSAVTLIGDLGGGWSDALL